MAWQAKFGVRLGMVVVGLLLLQVLAVHPEPGSAIQPAAPNLDVLPNRYIVMLPEVAAQGAETAAAAFDRRPGVAVDHVYQRVFRGFSAELSEAAAAALMRDPGVVAVFPDYVVTAQAQRLEPGINRVDADVNPTKAGNGSGSVDADIAIIDSGVGPNSDLNIAGGYDCWGEGILRDYYGHGTHVAGIAAAKDNSFGVVGVAPGARIWSVRVLNSVGNGGWSYIICGMDWVARHADVIDVANMSLGGTTWENGTGCDSSPSHAAVCAMTRAGVTVMAAACNDGSDASICTPGKYPEVISVSAFAEWDGKPGGLGGCKSTPDGFYGCDDRRASFSNYGATVDIAAIGVGVYSTLFDNRYGYWSGTSMATPHVTGAAALVIAQQGDLSPSQVRARLLRSAMSGPVPGDWDTYPEPILNVANLGPGTIDAPSSAKPGQRIRVEAGELIPGTKASFTFHNVTGGSETVEPNGTVDRTVTVPDLPYGKYLITVVNHQKTLTDRLLIRPLLTLGTGSGRVGDTVAIKVKGFAAGESVLVTFDTGASVRSVVRVRASASGVATGVFKVPAATRGGHTVTGTDESGHTARATFDVRSSVRAQTPVAAGSMSEVIVRGFLAGETIELRWGSSTGAVLQTATSSVTGSASANVPIPAGSSDGGHSLWAVGNLGSTARVTVTTFTPEQPTPTAAAGPSETAAPTVAVGTPTPSATAVATETATSTPETPSPSAETPSPSAETPTAAATP